MKSIDEQASPESLPVHCGPPARSSFASRKTVRSLRGNLRFAGALPVGGRGQMSRREILRRLAWLAFAQAPMASVWAADRSDPKKRLGLTAASYSRRWRLSSDDGRLPALADALGFLEHGHRLGAGGIQTGVGGWDAPSVKRLRERAEAWGMYVEGQIRLPKDRSDLDRFRAQIERAGQAGVRIVRTVALSGRRYETFDSAAAFREFKEKAWNSLVLAEPVVRRAGVTLAIENHKDWRVPELIGILERLSSEFMRVCVDTGNSISLLEDPMAVIEAYAPWAVTSHFKDMAVKEYTDGFLLSEVPLGDGFLDLRRIVGILQRHNPEIQFNLEMITRDPLEVPCLTDPYWETFPALSGVHLADTLRMVRAHPPAKPLPCVSGLTDEERLQFEEANVRRCFEYAKSKLAL